MKIENFFDNLQVFFENEDQKDVKVPCFIYRNEDGKITEIRLFNTEYEELLTIERNGKVSSINILEFEENLITK